jgi:hypothetical protein
MNTSVFEFGLFDFNGLCFWGARIPSLAEGVLSSGLK